MFLSLIEPAEKCNNAIVQSWPDVAGLALILAAVCFCMWLVFK